MRTASNDANFSREVKQATVALNARDFGRARAAIADAMGLNMDAPEPHNLLGILYEMMGDYQAARKHYRAGYALDPTYKPCCRNLERITGFDGSAFVSGRVYGEAAESPAGNTVEQPETQL